VISRCGRRTGRLNLSVSGKGWQLAGDRRNIVTAKRIALKSCSASGTIPVKMHSAIWLVSVGRQVNQTCPAPTKKSASNDAAPGGRNSKPLMARAGAEPTVPDQCSGRTVRRTPWMHGTRVSMTCSRDSGGACLSPPRRRGSTSPIFISGAASIRRAGRRPQGPPGRHRASR
jgi:hypothetical protein